MVKLLNVWKIVIIYALFGSLWIIVSDQLLYQFYTYIDSKLLLSITKGLLFIVVTSLLLSFLISRQNEKIRKSMTALRDSEQRFNFLVENSTDCLVVIDADGYQKYVSQGAERLFGFSRDQLKGKQIKDVVHPNDVDLLINAWNSVIKKDPEPITVEYRHAHENGGWVECEAVARSFLHDPAVQGVVANVRDISQRKRSERILLKRNQFITTILENLPIGLSVNHIDDGDAVYMNDKFGEIYGWPREELSDVDTFFEKVYPDRLYREKLKTRVLADIHSGDVERMFWTDLEATTKGGKKKMIEAKNIPIYEQNLMISTVLDITERNRLRQQLEQLQKLESIGRLAGGVAHDLNNLLTPILGFSEILLDNLKDSKDDVESLKEIQNAGNRARDLVQQLLAFSRKQVLEFQSLNVNDIIEKSQKLLSRTIPEDVGIEFILNPGILPVLGDEGQIHQVLLNLATNSSYAMPNGGKLTIETGLADLDESYASEHKGVEPGTYTMIAVSDTGKGMDEEDVERAFEPFFTTKGQSGTGLGLSTVYGIVKQHGGNVWLYSEPGRGTTVKVYLPVVEDEIKIHKIAENDIHLSGTETILVAEDAPQVRRLARRYLEKLGYKVLEAQNGDEALVIADEFQDTIHLLFTDVVMPGMNGNELYREMVKRTPGLKVLYTSGYTDNIIAHRGVLDKGVHFLQKPFDMHSLGKKIKEVLER